MRMPGGMTVATLTPYDGEGRVDEGAAREHAAWLVEAGIRALAPAGGTGGSLYLEAEGKRPLIRAAGEGGPGRAAGASCIWAGPPAGNPGPHARGARVR